jgi:hypothetical protein
VNALLIALPNSGSFETPFFKSMIGLTQALYRRKIPFAIKTYEFSDIMMSRNYLMSYFLSHEKFSHCFMADSDLSFAPSQFFRLYDLDVDYAAGLYPSRRLDIERFRKYVEENEQKLETSEIYARSLKYIYTEDRRGLGGRDVEWNGDFRTVATVGTGFLVLKRAVPEQMVAKGAARPLERTGRLPGYSDAPRFADFFSHHLTEAGDAFYGEDQSFSRRWVLGCGGRIWVDGKSRIGHHGVQGFYGDASVIKDHSAY